MKNCVACKRSVMGRRYMGMCPRCFNNFLQIMLIVFLIFVIPIVAFLVTVLLITPLSAFLGPVAAILGAAEILADVVLGVAAILGVIVGYGIVGFLVARYIINNKKYRI